MSTRPSGRAPDQLREVSLEAGANKYAGGRTRHCSLTVHSHRSG